MRVCFIKLQNGEDSVDSLLAMTPAQMQRLTSQGRAVSLSNLENVSFFGNEIDVHDMPLEYTRGIDVNTLWEQSRISEKKIKDFSKRTINTKIDGEKINK